MAWVNVVRHVWPSITDEPLNHTIASQIADSIVTLITETIKTTKEVRQYFISRALCTAFGGLRENSNCVNHYLPKLLSEAYDADWENEQHNWMYLNCDPLECLLSTLGIKLNHTPMLQVMVHINASLYELIDSM